MFILYAIVIGLLVGLALGGRPLALAGLRFRWAPLVFAGFLTQVALFSDAVAERVGDLGPLLYVASTAMVGAVVLRNASIPGVPLVILGAVSNLAAIVTNGGFMPAAPGAMAALGKAQPAIYSNSAIVARPALEPLTDIFALPAFLPFANIFSIGDVLIGVGVGMLIVVTMVGAGRSGARVRVDRQPAA